MPIRRQVSCIRKPDRDSRTDSIEAIGGVDDSGLRWQLTEAAAIAGLRTGTMTFWTKAAGVTAEVRAYERNGRWYLRTDADQTTKNNLLALPECP